VKKSFLNYDYIDRIEVIPSTYLKGGGPMNLYLLILLLVVILTRFNGHQNLTKGEVLIFP
jgi:hypothetical protein